MLLLTTIIYGIAASAVSHSIILSVGKTEAKTKPKKARGFYMLALISLAVFKMLLTQITPTPTSLLADIMSVIKSAKKKKKAQLKYLSLTGFSSHC